MANKVLHQKPQTSTRKILRLLLSHLRPMLPLHRNYLRLFAFLYNRYIILQSVNEDHIDII